MSDPAKGPDLTGESISVGDVRAQSAAMPETVCLLGASLEHVDERLRDLDRQRGLSLGSIVSVTPPVWIHLPRFRVQRRLVTNGEYRRFLAATHEDGGRYYDRRDLWRYLWGELAYRVESAHLPFQKADGTVASFQEDYRGCQDFVEAYVESIQFECQRLLLSSGHEAEDDGDDGVLVRTDRSGTERIRVPLGAVLKRLFRLVAYRLRDPRSDGGPVGRQVAAAYEQPEVLARDLDRVATALRQVYERRTDRRFRELLHRGQMPVETLVFLRRFREAIAATDDAHAPIGLHQVLYPRSWQTPQGQRPRSGFFSPGTPWDQRPVFGLSLYEATAYCAWLAGEVQADVQLPSEAELERAASWPQGEGLPDASTADGPHPVDPSDKHLFPWQGHTPHDFNYFFGRPGQDIASYYMPDAHLYRGLLEDTARHSADGPIYMLEGFGWQWTRDRHDPAERRYDRFDDANYPRFVRTPVCRADDDTPLTVYEYRTQRAVESPYYVLKGSPEVLGGPGLTVRRYATYPLRAYPNVGFRWVVRGGLPAPAAAGDPA